MASPDGVYHGLCKLNHIDGIDMDRQCDFSDSAMALLRDAIDKVKPDLYCEIHNWMLHRHDGILLLNWFQSKRFILNLPSQIGFKKKWKIFLLSPLKHPHQNQNNDIYINNTFKKFGSRIDYTAKVPSHFFTSILDPRFKSQQITLLNI